MTTSWNGWTARNHGLIDQVHHNAESNHASLRVPAFS